MKITEEVKDKKRKEERKKKEKDKDANRRKTKSKNAPCIEHRSNGEKLKQTENLDCTMRDNILLKCIGFSVFGCIKRSVHSQLQATMRHWQARVQAQKSERP